MNQRREHGVIIGSKRYTVDENGKFHLVEEPTKEDQD